MKTKNQNLKEKKMVLVIKSNKYSTTMSWSSKKREKKKTPYGIFWGKCFFRRHDCARLFFH